MFKKPLGIVAALIILGVAACGGGNGSGPAGVYPNPGSGPAGTSAINLTLTPSGGYNGSLSLTGTNPSSSSTNANVSAAFISSLPSGIPAVSKDRRLAQALTPPNPQAYIAITAGTGGASITSVSNVVVTLPSPVPSGLSLYVAYYDGTQWRTLGNPGTLNADTTSSYTLSGGPINPAMTLDAGASLYLALYEGSYAVPSPTPTPPPTATPANAITNGDFETGALSPGWTACSYAHTGYQTPVNPSPAPAATATQNPAVTTPLPAASLAPFVGVTAPPKNYNPNHLNDATGNLGSYAALTGSLNAQVNAATGICQTVTVPTDGQLSFQVYEGGTAYNFYNGDQEAQILDSTGSTILQTLFVELNCYYDSSNFPTEPAYASSGCFPSAYGGTSAYTDWQGGYWVQRGPYDLSAYAGQQVTLFLGTWTSATHAGPDSYANYMFVDNVSLTSGGPAPSPSPQATISATIQGGPRR